MNVSYAAQECFDVAESIKTMDDKKALSKVKTQLRLHLQELKKSDSSYEGQFDIACLIGLYMGRGNPSSDEALSRFQRIDGWVERAFGEKARDRLNDIWRYKMSDDLMGDEREDGYGNSEWVIVALARNAQGANKKSTYKSPSYPIDAIKDHIW
ncbi:uncharacterized protein METZ01_LOCUS476953, partial [marine metagenome]